MCQIIVPIAQIIVFYNSCTSKYMPRSTLNQPFEQLSIELVLILAS